MLRAIFWTSDRRSLLAISESLALSSPPVSDLFAV
jgi:hypothetical protein